MSKKKTTLWGSLVNFLASLKLSIFLFLTLAATSAFGTVIQQQRSPASYISSYGPTLAKIIQTLELVDMYHSWWFQLLLFLLLVNTLVCSMRRLPSALRQIGSEQFLDSSRLSKKKLLASWRVDGDKEQVIDDVLRKYLGGVRKQTGTLPGTLPGKLPGTRADTQPGEARWFAQKQRWARLGPYIAHVSLALFFLGGLVGAQYGMKGYVNIMEGSSISQVGLRSGGTLELPFEVACLKFELQKYPDGRPSDYLSHLEVRQGGKLIQSKTIEVNDPLVVDGIFFYQSNYGGFEGGALLTVLDREGDTLLQPVTIAEEKLRKIPGSNLSLELLSTMEDFKGYGPAAQLLFVSTEGGKHTHVGEPFIVFQRLPDYDKRRNSEHVVQLIELKPPQRYTGLQVVKDPGVPLVWGGALLLVLGTLGASFASHRRVWVALEEGQVSVAGFAAKNKQGFEADFIKLTASLREATGEPSVCGQVPPDDG
jgi:cytochrome c biogenesis protein